MEYITMERTIFDAMVKALAECRTLLTNAVCRLSGNERQEWIDNRAAQSILRKSQRTMTMLRAEGKIGYSIIEGKVFYPADEIGRMLSGNYIRYE